MAKRPEPKGPKPPLPGLLKLQTLWQTTFSGGRNYTAANVLHARWSDNVNHTLSDLQGVADNYFAHWSTNFLPSISAAWEMTATVVTSLGGDGLQATHAALAPGTAGGNCLPPQCAACITWKAAIAWRGGRPRTYMPGIPQNATTGTGPGQLTSTYATALASAAVTFMNAVGSDLYETKSIVLGFPSYFTQYAFRPTPIFFPYLTAVVHDRLDSQRRRTGKESTFPIE